MQIQTKITFPVQNETAYLTIHIPIILMAYVAKLLKYVRFYSSLCAFGGSYKLLRVVVMCDYETRPQSTFPTRRTASKPYIARSDCA
jgi:hypothetical protein